MNQTKSKLAEVIRERRSIKTGYLDKPVPTELVKELLEDAVWAPTHGMREPWRFIYVPSEQKEAFVSSLVDTFPEERKEDRRDYFSKPSAFLIVVMDEDPRQKVWEENFGAVSCLLQNFQLLAWERDLGVVWKTNPHIYDPDVHELLGIQPDEKVVGFIHMGYFDEKPEPKKRTSIDDKFTLYTP